MRKYKFKNNITSGYDLFIEPSEKNTEKEKFVPKVRNTFLLMQGNSKITAPIEEVANEITTFKIDQKVYLNYTSESLDTSFRPGVRVQLGTIFAIQSDVWDIRFNLIPKSTNYDIRTVVNSFFDGTISSMPFEFSDKDFWLYITYKDLRTQQEKRYFIEYTLSNHVWYDFRFIINDGKMSFVIDGTSQTKIYEASTDVVLEELICTDLLKTGFTAVFCWNMFAAVKQISIAQNDAYIIHPYEHFEDHLYMSFYSTLVCDPNCPKACKEFKHDVVNEEFIWKPCTEITADSPANQELCDFEATDEQPYCPLTHYVENDLAYPQKYDMEDGMILSPHYKINISLTEAPLGDTYIINKGLAESIYDSFEEARPAARVSHYVETADFETDFSGKLSSLYDKSYNANWSVRSTIPQEIVEGGEIVSYGGDGMEDKSSVWIIEHNANTMFVVCQFFDENWNEIYPLTQYPLDKYTYRVEWSFPASGTAVMKNSEFTTEIKDGQDETSVTHPFTASEWPVIYQLQDHLDLEKEEAKNVDLLRNTATVDFEFSYPKKNSWILINNVDRMYKFRDSKIWTVKHDLDVMGLQIQVYDNSFNLIVPENIEIADNKEVIITFDTETSGIVGLKLVGNPTWKDDAIFDIVGGGGYVLLGDLSGINYSSDWGKNFSSRTYDEELYGKRTIQSDRFIRTKIYDYWEDNQYYYLKFIVPEYDYPDFNINEIGIFSVKDELCFYAVGDDIYKPKEMAFESTFKISKKDLSIARLSSAPTNDESDTKYYEYDEIEGVDWDAINLNAGEEVADFDTSYVRVTALKKALPEKSVSIRIYWEDEEVYKELYEVPENTSGTHAYNRILAGETFTVGEHVFKPVLPYYKFTESNTLTAYYLKVVKI